MIMSVDAGFSPWTIGCSRWPPFRRLKHRLKRLQSYMSTVRKNLKQFATEPPSTWRFAKVNMFQQNLKETITLQQPNIAGNSIFYLSKYHQNAGVSSQLCSFTGVYFCWFPCLDDTSIYKISVMRWDHLKEGCQ